MWRHEQRPLSLRSRAFVAYGRFGLLRGLAALKQLAERQTCRTRQRLNEWCAAPQLPHSRSCPRYMSV
jgi:hypothetical protein